MLKRRSTRRVFYNSYIILKMPVLMLIVFLIFAYSPILSLRVGDVIVSDNSVITKDVSLYVDDVLKETWYGIPLANIFFFNTGEIVKRIESRFLSVEQVKIDRTFLKIIDISLETREVFGVQCLNDNDSECTLIDRYGFVFGRTNIKTGVLIEAPIKIMPGKLVFVGDEVTSRKKFNTIYNVVRELEKKNIFTRKIEVFPDINNVKLHLQDYGIEIEIDVENSLQDTTRELYFLFEEIFFEGSKERESLKYIDVTDIGMIIYEKKRLTKKSIKE